ncbi:hypothetical protein [Deinococcus arcticus]|uniref:Uncharacterized protein n=1 Tax=Deinococcus arcticus TaxID=2136176 RepID=A0A2T3W9S7_9DEIO|nr:hypothetical protein [Deinococcus arcticus]PTA68645.1 hypothetical protein C8263_05165 [Deinococcus arcticus]
MTAQATFESWLEEVTAPFPADTAWRLRAEFRGHHEQAVDALTRLGDPAPAQTALRELGEPATVIAALEHTHFTRADLAWMERDAELKRLLADPERRPQGPVRWRDWAQLPVWVAIGTYLICGWPGHPSPLMPEFPFAPLVPALLTLSTAINLTGHWLISQRPARSAAVLARCWAAINHPFNGALLLLFMFGLYEWVLALWLILLGLTVLRRPREALSLLPKAWRSAQ